MPEAKGNLIQGVRKTRILCTFFILLSTFDDCKCSREDQFAADDRACEGTRVSHAQAGTTRALVGLRLKLRLKARYGLGPVGPQPMRNLKPKLKTKPDQCPSSMSARVTDAGTRTRAGPPLSSA
jgi:hypothetical protein